VELLTFAEKLEGVGRSNLARIFAIRERNPQLIGVAPRVENSSGRTAFTERRAFGNLLFLGRAPLTLPVSLP
jgi:hypothetical protein